MRVVLVFAAVVALSGVLVDAAKIHGHSLFYVVKTTDIRSPFEIRKIQVPDEDDFKCEEDKLTVACVVYDNQINQTGWAFLELETSHLHSDMDQAAAAGYTEGFLTADLIALHVHNVARPFCDGRKQLCSKIRSFIMNNMSWIRSMFKEAPKDAYWHQVELLFTQLDNILNGYNFARQKNPTLPEITTEDIYMLNLDGDLEDLVPALGGNSVDRQHPLLRGSGSCSALIKIVGFGSELFVAHDTWSSYESMLRIQKKYTLRYKLSEQENSTIPGAATSFSSYPGIISSGDDFYVIASGLVTLETTIGNGNASLWKNIKPTEQVPEFVRSVVANRMATDGLKWAKIFSKYNSGTYNNQWMVVDYNKWEKGTTKSGLLYVLEQLPGFIQYKDLTPILKKDSYFASYNVPYFPTVFNMSGSRKLAEEHGDWFTYDKCPRANIFRRDHAKVRDMQSMWSLMRYNDFKTDPLSKCNCTPTGNGENAIAARSDLNPANGKYPWGALRHRNHGATDAKITSYSLAQTLQFMAESGPTHYSPSCPPFSWSTADFADTTPHMGLPDKWTFKPVTHEWFYKTKSNTVSSNAIDQ